MQIKYWIQSQARESEIDVASFRFWSLMWCIRNRDCRE